MKLSINPLEVKFQSALEAGEAAIEAAVSRVIDAVSDDSISFNECLAIVALAQEKREWNAVLKVGDAVMGSGNQGPVPAELVRRYAQALIEVGALRAAELVLERLSRDGLEDQGNEVAGLRGRIAKQRYVNFKNSSQLGQSIEAYTSLYLADGGDRLWAGVNLLALLHRADTDGIDDLPETPGRQALIEDLSAIIDSGDHDDQDLWVSACAVELDLARGDDEAAVRSAARFIKTRRATQFQLGSIRRQLAEVWGLPVDHEVLISLANAEISVGTDASVDVPGPDSLQKIFGTYPVTYQSLLRGLHKAQFVCRISDRNGYPIGTGFAIPGSQLRKSWSDDLVLCTNHHVIPSAVLGMDAVAEFTKLCWGDNGAESVEVGDLEQVWSSPTDELDTTILSFDQRQVPKAEDPIRLANRPPQIKGVEDPFVYVVGHPRGRPLEMSIRGNDLKEMNSRKLQYLALTEQGSSGSPIFDRYWDLIGLHHRGAYDLPLLSDPHQTHGANEGIRIDAIKAAIEAAAL